MWIVHLLSLLHTTWSYFWTAVGQTFAGAVLGTLLASVVTVGTVRHGARSKNWKEMFRHWVEERFFATKLLFKALLLIYGPFALFKFAQVVYDDHVSSIRLIHAQAAAMNQSRSEFLGTVTTCQQTLLNTQEALRQKVLLVDSLEQGITNLEGPQAQQAANIASCITNLSKMNPIIREKISVIQLQFATSSSDGNLNPNPFQELPVEYVSELFIMTNEPERMFRGVIGCKQPFRVSEGPRIIPIAGAVISSNEPIRPIRPNAYGIAINATGVEWNPTHPAYLQVTSASKDLGGCSFAAEE